MKILVKKIYKNENLGKKELQQQEKKNQRVMSRKIRSNMSDSERALAARYMHQIRKLRTEQKHLLTQKKYSAP